MARGLSLLEKGKREDLPEAVQLFTAAIAIRRAVPPSGDPWRIYNLAGSLMNLGDALTRQGTAAKMAAGGKAYEDAVALLVALPRDGDPLFLRRLLVGHLNSGLNHLFRGPDTVAAAANDFSAALALADSPLVLEWPDRGLLAAAAAANLASAELRRSEWDAAIAAARRAEVEADPRADQEVACADAAIRARHTHISALISRWQHTGAERPDADTLSAATDAAEEGLRLSRAWDSRGVAWFRPLAVDLFRTGARLYASFQPQFLAEFLNDYAAADPETANQFIQAAIKKRLPS